ncbi:hypothetical protein AHAS_Ahas11G0095300 [Arachis hypogaea]
MRMHRVIGVHCRACNWDSKLLMTLSTWWPPCSASTTCLLIGSCQPPLPKLLLVLLTIALTLLNSFTLISWGLIYLDSAKNLPEHDARIAQMKYVAIFIENMLQDTRFLSDKGHYKPYLSTFDIEAPEVRQQIEYSMRLALDLVMGRHNSIACEVAYKAMTNWDRNMSLSKRCCNSNNAPAPSSPSPSCSLTF